MRTETGRADERITKPVQTEIRRDFFDPHFPTRLRATGVSNQKRTEIFDPHFPQRVRQ